MVNTVYNNLEFEHYSKKLKIMPFAIDAGKLVSVMHETDAKELGVLTLDRLELTNPANNKKVITVVDITKEFVSAGNLGIFERTKEKLSISKGEEVIVKVLSRPLSVSLIKKKMCGEKLSKEEIKQIVEDIGENKLSDIEASAFMTAVFINGYSLDETVAMAESLVENGQKILFDVFPIVDKHSIGGINGRATMIVVPIVASAGLYIPKTSSRSITSAAGTADSMEVLANVSLGMEQIKKIMKKTCGVICWGGALDLAPVDDMIIRIERPLGLDPPGQIIASVMAKKASVGAKAVVIDIPVGPGMKINTREKGADLARNFIAVGKKMGLQVEAVLTDGKQPSGKAFGPVLEARYVMQILEGKFFDALAQKSCELAGVLFELSGKAKKGKGTELAKKILESGQALNKMQEIIKAQGAIALSSEEIELSDLKKEVKVSQAGEVSFIDVKKLIIISRIAGCPGDKKAGVLLHVEPGDKVKTGNVLFEIFAENRRKLDLAYKFAVENLAVELEKIILEKFE